MQKLTDYMRQRLTVAGWEILTCNDIDLIARQDVSPNQSIKVWVCYLAQPTTPEQIRRCFDFQGYLLFVVAEQLIPDIKDRDTTPRWLQVLHDLYMGRVYVWNGKGVNGLHFDYYNGGIEESGYITVNDLQLEETQTWLKGWNDTYKMVFLWERIWWKTVNNSGFKNETWERIRQEFSERMREHSRRHWEDMFQGRWMPPEPPYGAPPHWKAPDPPPREGEGSSSSRQSYEQARDSYWEQMRKRTGQAPGGKAFWENDIPNSSGPKWRYADYQDFRYEPKPPPASKQEASRLDLFGEFMACASLTEARKLWKKLLIENHPDKFIDQPEKQAAQTALTQEINAAYQKAERYLK